MKPVLHGYYERVFIAVQQCAVPRSRDLSEAGKRESLRLVNAFLADRPASIQFRLHLFLVFIDALALLTAGGRFPNLPDEKQARVLSRLFDSSLDAVRKGFWGLNTLTKLGIYGQPSLYTEMGYRLRPTPHDGQDH